MDFTFVCPTEIAEFGRRNRDFEDRDAVVLGASTDTHFVHLTWRRRHDDLRTLPFPMLADTKRALDTIRDALPEAARDMQSHERAVLEAGLTEDNVHDAVRIAATIHAAAVALESAGVAATA